MTTEYYLDAAARNAPSNAYAVQINGRNALVSTSFVPVAYGGVYQTPTVANGTKLRIKSGGNANDTANGSGARVITIVGMDVNGDRVEEDVLTAGASASSETQNTYIRLLNAYVKHVGTYGTVAAGSHAGDIVIENAAGGTTWATINSTGFARGRTEIGCYTVPKGKQAYVQSIHVSIDTNQTCDLIFFKRDGILLTTTPYNAMTEIHAMTCGASNVEVDFHIPLGPFGPLTDIGVLAKMSSSSSAVQVFYDVLVRDQE